MLTALDHSPALVLNADFRPLSYFPLSVWDWQDTIKAVVAKRVNVISEYDMEVRSPTFALRLPSVISLKEYVAPARRPAFTRFNVFLRDRLVCQDCDGTFPANMPLLRAPIEPSTWELQEHGRAFPPNFLHESWRDYLYWDTELET